jgi:hypothetical protein
LGKNWPQKKSERSTGKRIDRGRMLVNVG